MSSIEAAAKTCSSCSLELPLVKFGKLGRSKDGLRGQCNDCRNSYRRDWRARFKEANGCSDLTEHRRRNPEVFAKREQRRLQELRDWVDSLKDKPCADCGGSFPPVCMDFDHVRGEKRMGGVARLVGNRLSREVILAEIAKCDLVCANCHRIRTWRSDRPQPWFDKVRKHV